MKNSKISKEMIDDVFAAILRLDSADAANAFFSDLCTYTEIENMAQRFHAAKLLSEGKTYTQVSELTDISSATLSRVSRALQFGSGYKAALEKAADINVEKSEKAAADESDCPEKP